MSTLTYSRADQLEALDRGVIAVGLTADEAVARVDALEAEVASLKRVLIYAFSVANVPWPETA